MLQLDDYANSTQVNTMLDSKITIFIRPGLSTKKKRKRDAERMLAGSEDIQS